MRPIEVGARALVAAAVVAALAIGEAPGEAQTAVPPIIARFLGRYTHESPDGGRAHIEARTEEIIAELRPAIRGIGRRRILRNNPPIPALVIDYVDGELVVEYVGQGRRYHAPPNGPAVENTAPEGGSVDVSYRVRRGVIVEDMRTRRGRATAEYVLCPEEHELTLTTTIVSGSLPRELIYEHVLRGPER